MLSIHTLSGAAAIAALAILPAGDEPKLALEKGTVLTRRYEGTNTLESRAFRMYMGDEEVPAEGHPEFKLSVGDQKTLTFVDTYVAVEGGRATKLEREVQAASADGTEKMEITPDGGETKTKETKRERSSKLTGKKVRFAWDAEAKEWTKSFAGEKGDADLLEGLEPDLELAGFLPGHAVKDGDSWELAPRLFTSVRHPGGNLRLVAEGEERDALTEKIDDQIDEHLSGDAKATWRGTREVDGHKLGVIEVESELETEAQAENEETGEARSLKLKVHFSGELLWDLEGGHAAGYSLGGPSEATYSFGRKMKGHSGDVLVRQEFDLTGEAKHTLRVER